MITIKCRTCPKFRRVDATKDNTRESSRMLAVCHATNNVLTVISPDGTEPLRPTAQDVIYGKIIPDVNCPKVRRAQMLGRVQWADFTIMPDGTGRGWLQDVIY